MTTLKDYRFKTESEFKNEYGLNWRAHIIWDVSGRMDMFFGKNLTEFLRGDALNELPDRAFQFFLNGDKWVIYTNMIKKIETEHNTIDVTHINASNKLQYRFKTEDELIDDLGVAWYTKTGRLPGFCFGKGLNSFSIVKSTPTRLTLHAWELSGEDKNDTFDSRVFTKKKDGEGDLAFEIRRTAEIKRFILYNRFKTKEELERDCGKYMVSHHDVDYMYGRPLSEFNLSDIVIETLFTNRITFNLNHSNGKTYYFTDKHVTNMEGMHGVFTNYKGDAVDFNGNPLSLSTIKDIQKLTTQYPKEILYVGSGVPPAFMYLTLDIFKVDKDYSHILR